MIAIGIEIVTVTVIEAIVIAVVAMTHVIVITTATMAHVAVEEGVAATTGTIEFEHANPALDESGAAADAEPSQSQLEMRSI